MTDDEKIKNFGDMVEATEKLTKPAYEENIRLHEEIDKMHRQMFWERIVLGGIIALIIALSYLTPVTSEQSQNFVDQTQTQSYSDGVTKDK